MKPTPLLRSFAILSLCVSTSLALPPATSHAQSAPEEIQSTKGWLGVHLSTANDPSLGGVLVRRSIPASPADNAGLVRGDIILQVDGVPVRTADEMIRLVGQKTTGARILLDVNGPNPRQVTAVLSVHPGDLRQIGRRLIGQPAPASEALNLQSGMQERVNPVDGKVRIVELWATWCGPCRTVQPKLTRQVESMDEAHFEFVAVASEDPGTVLRYIRSNPVNYRVLADPDEEVGSLFWTSSTPTFILIDAKGRVVRYSSGISDVDQLFEEARQLVEASK